MNAQNDTHGFALGYLLWIFGFTGAHRFYYGKQLTGTLWFCTGGFFLIGWIIDIFLIPGMAASAGRRYREGRYSYELTWILLTFLGLFGIHRIYIGKWFTGLLWLVTGGLFGFGWLWDLWTINAQIDEANGISPLPPPPKSPTTF